MDLPLQIETSMSGTRPKIICSLVVILIGHRACRRKLLLDDDLDRPKNLQRSFDRISEWKMRTPHVIPST